MPAGKGFTKPSTAVVLFLIFLGFPTNILIDYVILLVYLDHPFDKLLIVSLLVTVAFDFIYLTTDSLLLTNKSFTAKINNIFDEILRPPAKFEMSWSKFIMDQKFQVWTVTLL